LPVLLTSLVVEMSNIVVVVRTSLQKQEEEGGIRRDSYGMDINRERRYFNCGGLGHIACYYRN